MTPFTYEQPIRVPSPKVKVRMPASSFNSPSGHRSWSVRKALPCLLGGIAMTLLVYRSTPAMRVRVVNKTNLKGGWRGQQGDGAVLTKKAPRPPFPPELLGTNYGVSDFWNLEGIKVPYWNGLYDLGFRREHGEAEWMPPSNLSYFGDDDDYIRNYLSDEDDDFFGVEREAYLPPNAAWSLNGTTRNTTFPGVRGDSWGPCYPPSQGVNDAIDWHEVVEAFRKNPTMTYPEKPSRFVDPKKNPQLLDGMCRPGFLIIGAGKCGTSSLFHYLTSHPKVAPPRKKQIGFFTYELGRGMKWYLSHFPSTESFLASGALITGEAFPGYLPYPPTVASTQRLMPGVKLIASVRDPLSRAWSSYNYNYVQPALKKLRNGIGAEGVPSGRTDDYYVENHMWSFEVLVRAELDVLRPCLLGDPEGDNAGTGVAMSRKFKFSWAKTEYRRREEEGLQPMVDYAVCYGSKVSRTVPRKQWAALVESDPGRIVDVPNLHMAQSHIGRGLYSLPLEWWYAAFPRDDIHVMCLEDMGVESMNDVTSFLGLPKFDYSDVLAQGRYNVAGHKGYDKLTTLEEARNISTASSEIPLSDKLRQEVLEFYQPFNERLFRLAAIRCPWGEGEKYR